MTLLLSICAGTSYAMAIHSALNLHLADAAISGLLAAIATLALIITAAPT